MAARAVIAPYLSSQAARGPVRRIRMPVRLRVTFAGLLYTIVLGLLGLAALSNEINLLFLLFSVCMGVLLFSAAAPVWMLRRVDCERALPDAVVAGRPFKVTYTLRSRRRWTRAWSIMVTEKAAGQPRLRLPHAFIPMLNPRAEARVELDAVCPHRGAYELAATRLLCRFPFGLFAAAAECPAPAELVVYPPLGRFRSDPWRMGRGGGGSGKPVRRHDAEEEFYGIREYREGDSPSRVHWRISARTGELVVREMMPLRSSQLIVLLDPWPGEAEDADAHRSRRGSSTGGGHASGRKIDPAAERAISAAATAICDGLERGYRVGLICRAAIPVLIPPASGRAHRPRLLRELALLSDRPAEPLEALLARARWASGLRSRCLLCTPAAGPAHQRVRQLLLGRAESVAVLTAKSEHFDVLPEARPRRTS